MAQTLNTGMKAFDGMQALPIAKQVALLLGLAASIALAVYVALWAQGTDYVPLGGQFTQQDTAEVVDALDRNGIDHRLDAKTGLVLVASTQLQQAKLKLAKEGISREGGYGLELLDKDNGLTTSQFIERTRYIRGLQGELERTISQIQQIKKARVHLAIPKQNAFIRHKKPPSASVFVDVIGGVKLSATQVGAISNLVATSIQGLSPDKVTVIDQFGTLLSSQAKGELAQATEQLEYKEKLESLYAQRVYDLLAPLVGEGRVRAKVTADIDYTGFEKTFENFNPEKTTVRSEQTLDVEKGAQDFAGGVPGALSNVPPNNPVVPQTTPEVGELEGENLASINPRNVRKQATRNYEVDRTIGHERKLPGNLLKLSVAVVVDHKMKFAKGGKVSKSPFSEEEIQQMDKLVKDAIGFDAQRGDKVTVINSPFAESAPIEDLPALSFHQQPWFGTLLKQALGGLVVLLILFMVIRPFMRNLANVSHLEKEHKQKMLEIEQERERLINEGTNLDDITRVRSLVQEDPKRMAQVVKSMVTTNNE